MTPKQTMRIKLTVDGWEVWREAWAVVSCTTDLAVDNGDLRKRDYLPILFDFEKPVSRDTDETITLLARMARFVIADISDAKAVLQELRAIVPDLPSVPVQSIILATHEEPGVFDFYRNRPSFLTVPATQIRSNCLLTSVTR